MLAYHMGGILLYHVGLNHYWGYGIYYWIYGIYLSYGRTRLLMLSVPLILCFLLMFCLLLMFRLLNPNPIHPMNSGKSAYPYIYPHEPRNRGIEIVSNIIKEAPSSYLVYDNHKPNSHT